MATLLRKEEKKLMYLNLVIYPREIFLKIVAWKGKPHDSAVGET